MDSEPLEEAWRLWRILEVLLLDMRWDLHTKKCIIKIQRMELGTVGAAIRVKF